MDGQDSSVGENAATAAKQRRRGRARGAGRQQAVVEEGAAVACNGKTCQSCTAGAIADCVAVCCCPCAVVNFFTLTFFRLPWAVARRCLGGGGRRKGRRRGRREALEGGNSEGECRRRGEDTAGICESGRAGDVTSEIALSSPVTGGGERNDDFGAEFKVEEVWLEVGHMGFGRVSFTGVQVQAKGS